MDSIGGNNEESSRLPITNADSILSQGAIDGSGRDQTEEIPTMPVENRVSRCCVASQRESERPRLPTTRERPLNNRRRITALHNSNPVVTDPSTASVSQLESQPEPPRFKLQNPPNPQLRRTQKHRRNLSSLGGSHNLNEVTSASPSDLTVVDVRTRLPFRLKYRSDTLSEDTTNVPELDMAGNHSFPSLDSPIAGNNRSAASPTGSIQGGQSNGSGMTNPANYMAPLPVGHQQDLNYLYAQIQELSALLKSNRERVSVVTKAAEEVARRASTNGAHTEGEEHRDDDKARIHDLERQLARANYTIDLYKHEQTENTNLIAEYEDALGNATEGIRNYCLGNEERFLSQRRHYNNLLQQEKDEHLQSRLDRDHWNAQTLRLCEMIRTAHRLRDDEWGEEYTVIAALQTEVRCFRRIIGLDPERPEEEAGWPYLKDAPIDDIGKNG